MVLSTAAAAVQILNGTWTAIQNMRERIQASKDHDLKAKYGELLDGFNSLRVTVIQLSEENEELRRSSADKSATPTIKQVGETNYYFMGDEGPYCQKCFDKDGKRTLLSPQSEFAGGTGRQCILCETTFFEQRRRQTRIKQTYNPYSNM
ncbi:MAG TPA: hypothetical protein VHX20_01145 [Terracidiphilus sp.]|jgi:hypothetical protein|nr:hypothetical protein [Terracidiphilus sp.]